jgi:FMN phosphatase YigB (HAD superfamily)
MQPWGGKMNRIEAVADFHYFTSNCDFVSPHMFDAVTRRRFITAHQVHDCASAYALALLGQRGKSPASDLTAMRYRMGGALKVVPELSFQEPRLVDVWDRILSQFYHVRDRELRKDVTDKVVRFEQELDKSNLAPTEGVVELLEKLRGAGKTVIAISDNCFSAAQMSDILKQLDLLRYFDHLFDSAEVNATKQKGHLFVTLTDQLGIGADELIHVGDNIVLDVKVATNLGVNAVLVEQHELLKLEVPAYGGREQIAQNVADLVKAHLYSVLFDVLDRDATKIYFMARDGIAFQEFLKAWESPLCDAFLTSPDHETLFLNRVLMCWSNVDFSSEWLASAVGWAFWLKEGEATLRAIAEILGVDPVLPEAGEGKLDAATYQFKLAAAFRESGLEEAIKREIIAKRRVVQRHLEGPGFYPHRAVALGDISYSGKVGRALNTILLQLSAEGSDKSPPSVRLYLVASWANFSENSRFAQPHCSFAEQVVIPFSAPPRNLSDSYAWLEYFFKHPPLLPVKGFTEQGGEIRPEMWLRRQQRLTQCPHRTAQIAWITQPRPTMLPPGGLGPHRSILDRFWRSSGMSDPPARRSQAPDF